MNEGLLSGRVAQPVNEGLLSGRVPREQPVNEVPPTAFFSQEGRGLRGGVTKGSIPPLLLPLAHFILKSSSHNISSRYEGAGTGQHDATACAVEVKWEEASIRDSKVRQGSTPFPP